MHPRDTDVPGKKGSHASTSPQLWRRVRNDAMISAAVVAAVAGSIWKQMLAPGAKKLM